MSTLIVTGGEININFILERIKNNKYENIIAVDRGLEILDKINIMPNYIIGDFDSINKSILNKYEKYKNIKIDYLKPEKDYTDTHMALKLALDIKDKRIDILRRDRNKIRPYNSKHKYFKRGIR